MGNDDDQTPLGGDESDDTPSDLSAALGDLLAGGLGDDGPDRGPAGGAGDLGDELGEGLDLSALEDAVAELGLDVDTPGEPATADDARMLEVEQEKTRSLGLDLTELPPPSAPAPKPDLPPLGQATADDLFGHLGIDDGPSGPPSTWADDDSVGGYDDADDEPDALDDALSAPPASAGDAAAAAPDADDEPIQLPAPEPPPLAEPDPAMDDVVGFTAHGGTITGEIRAKAKKLFGR